MFFTIRLRLSALQTLLFVAFYAVAMLVALPATSLLAPVFDPDSVRHPIDLYFLVDKSGSVSSHDSEIGNFAQQLQLRVAQLAGGYYTNSCDGLRVAITSFACNGMQTNPIPLAHDFVTGPTGNLTKIAAGLNTMRMRVPSGGSCPSKGLQRFNASIVVSRVNEAPRPTAVIILTDGDIWPRDLVITQEVASGLRNMDNVFLFGIHYGKSMSTMRQWINLIGDPKRTFSSTDLDQVSTLLATEMLGDNQVKFAPTALQRARVANYTGNITSAVCLGENSVPLALHGRSISLFTASELVCELTRLETNQTFQVSAVAREAGVFCDIPGSLSRRNAGAQRFEQTFSLKLASFRNNVKTNIYSFPLVSINVVVCLNVKLRQSGSTEQHACYPPKNSTSSSAAALLIAGPTVDSQDAFFCRFDASNRVQAVRKDSVVECLAPWTDINSALLAGTHPYPYSRLIIETLLGDVLLDSMGLTPTSCIDTRKTERLEYCWNEEDDGTSPAMLNAVFEGQSLRNLIEAFENLEFSCVYEYGNMSREVDAIPRNDTQSVECGAPPAKYFFAHAFPITIETRLLSVALRVRSSRGEPSRTGWWIMKTENAFPVIVSPCLSSAVSPVGTCLGEDFTVTMQGEGIANFLISAGGAQCHFLTSTGETLRTDTLKFNGTAGKCVMKRVSSRLAKVDITADGMGVLHSILLGGGDGHGGSSPLNPVVPCFEIDMFNTSDPFCWGVALSEEQVRITGKSVQYYSKKGKLPFCKFELHNGMNRSATVRVNRKGENSFVCSVPRTWGFPAKTPLQAKLLMSLEDDLEHFSILNADGGTVDIKVRRRNRRHQPKKHCRRRRSVRR